MPNSPVKDLFRITARMGRLLYYALLGIAGLIVLVFFTNVFTYLCSYVSQELINLIDFIFNKG